MTSFRATFGLTRSIGGWEEGERRERNKRKRQPGWTSAGQRREWQLYKLREEISMDVEEREETFCSLFENEKERERGSNLRRQGLASSTAQVLVVFLPRLSTFFFHIYTYLFALFVQLPFSSFSLLTIPNRPCQFEHSPEARHEADSFEPAVCSQRLTPGQSGWLGAAAVGSIPALALSLSKEVNNSYSLVYE